MNSDQIASLVRTVFKIIGAFLVAHGYAKTASLLGGEDIIGYVVAGIGILLSHINHASDPTTPTTNSSAGKIPLMLLALLVLPATFFVGCSTTPQRVAYQAAGTTIVSVDTAMNFWGVYVAANHPSTNAEAQVKSAYEKYQAGIAVLTDAGAAYAATDGTNGTASAALNVATANVATEISDLENLLSSFGVKFQ
jgi:hypothetical protein